MCVLFCAEASFLDERPLTTPSLFLPRFPLDLSSTDPFFLPTHPTPFHLLLFSLCVLSLFLFSLPLSAFLSLCLPLFMLPSILGFLSIINSLSFSDFTHARLVGATAALSYTQQSWQIQTIVLTKSVSAFFFLSLSLSLFQTSFSFCGQATLGVFDRMQFLHVTIRFQVFFS